MDVKMLQNYNEWRKRTPAEILEAVKNAGGWRAVFPHGLPLWAHRVRNYFNYEPLFLIRLDKNESDILLQRISKNFSSLWSKDGMLQRTGLSGDVYRDNNGRIWYQMSPGATIYHYGSDPKNPQLEAVLVQLRGQGLTPVFKLFSLDGTGGSCETIILNQRPKALNQMLIAGMVGLLNDTSIGLVGVIEYVHGRLITDPWYQGSYNYAETCHVGNPAHEKYDVVPHKKNNFQGVYVNPHERMVPLSSRKFPEYAPGERKPLAEQL